MTKNIDSAIALLYNCGEDNQDQLFWENINEPHKSILEECYYLNEEGKYSQLEEITNSIKYHRLNYIKLGVQLHQVKYYQLYKKKYQSFKSYCQKAVYYPVWRANQLIECASIAIKLIEAGFIIIPQNEAQARRLTHLKEEELIEKWQEVVDTYKPHQITANRIYAIVSEKEIINKRNLKLPLEIIEEIERKALENQMSAEEFISKIITGDLRISIDGNVENKEEDRELIEYPTKENFKKWEKDLDKLAFDERNKLDEFTEELAEELKNTVTDLKQVIKKCFIEFFAPRKRLSFNE